MFEPNFFSNFSFALQFFLAQMSFYSKFDPNAFGPNVFDSNISDQKVHWPKCLWPKCETTDFTWLNELNIGTF